MSRNKSAENLSEWAGKLKWRGPDRRLPPLLFLTDRTRQPEPAHVIARLPKGSGVILRDYDAPGRLDLARRLATQCRRRGLIFLVGADADMAVRVRADGLHLPEHRVYYRPPPRKASWLVTAAAHSYPAIERAAALGLDAVLVSPVFPTKSHPQARALGARQLAVWVRRASVPIYALGGVDAGRMRQLHGLGLAGVAGISGF